MILELEKSQQIHTEFDAAEKEVKDKVRFLYQQQRNKFCRLLP